jgi:tetratricopeptide (TPR) repeat protein
MTTGLQPPDSHHLNAAEGWLGLGSTEEAERELAKLSLGVLSHPEVLRVKYHFYERTIQWERAAETARLVCQIVPDAPFGWVHLAYALHELRRTSEAYGVLLPVLQRFPKEYVMRYNLACYSCQLGRLDEACEWLKKAIALVGADTIKKMAVTDPDLEPLRAEIRNL